MEICQRSVEIEATTTSWYNICIWKSSRILVGKDQILDTIIYRVFDKSNGSVTSSVNPNWILSAYNQYLVHK